MSKHAKEILMWTDDAFSTPYIVTARTRLEAAKIVAVYRGQELEWVKQIYKPLEMENIDRIQEGDEPQSPAERFRQFIEPQKEAA